MTAATRARPHRDGRTRRKPQRTCIACRQTRAKHELVRIVRDTAGAVAIDTTGKRSGRGAYLCADAGCWERGLRGNALEHRLLLESPLSREDRGRLSGEAERVLLERRKG